MTYFRKYFYFVCSILLLVSLVIFYSGDNKPLFYHYLMKVINGTEINLGNKVYLINTELVSILSEREGVYHLKFKHSTLDDETLLAQRIGLETHTMILKGILSSEAIFSSKECDAYKLVQSKKIKFNTLVRFEEEGLELLSNRTLGSEEIETLYCNILIESRSEPI